MVLLDGRLGQRGVFRSARWGGPIDDRVRVFATGKPLDRWAARDVEIFWNRSWHLPTLYFY